jgi:hypothetical protein
MAKVSLCLVQVQDKDRGIPIPGRSGETNEENQSTDVETGIEASIEARILLEWDLHSYLAARISEIESGLILVDNGIEYPTEAGRIDLLARYQQAFGCNRTESW